MKSSWAYRKLFSSTGKALVIIAMSTSMSAHSALAQQGPTSPPSLTSPGSSSGNGSSIRAPGAAIQGNAEAAAPSRLPDSGSTQGFGETMITDPRIRMNPSGLETGEGGFTALNARSNEMAPSVFQDPESGVSAIMHEGAWRRISSNLTNSPLSLHNIALQLTDPAVATGASNALIHSFGVNQLAYQSQGALMQQFSLGGNEGYTQAVSMINCQRQEILRQQERNEPESWHRARMACQGAYDTSLSAGTGGGQSVQEPRVDGATFSLAQDPSLNVVDCKEMARFYQNQPENPAQRNSQVMSFVDVRMSHIEEDPNLGPQYIQNFKSNWGDILYSYQVDWTENQQDHTKPVRTSLLATCVVPPTTPVWEQAQQSETEHWNAMMSLLEERCKAGAKQQAAADEYVPFDPVKRNAFYELGENLTAPFSFGRFTFKASTIDVIYNLFIVKEIGELTEETCRERLSPTVPKNDLARLKARQEKTRLEHRAVHALVVWIVQGKMLENAHKAISELAEGSRAYTNPSDARAPILPAFFQLIARGIGIADYRDIPELSDANFQMITRYIEALQQQAATESGKGVDLLRSPFDKSGNSNALHSGYGGGS